MIKKSKFIKLLSLSLLVLLCTFSSRAQDAIRVSTPQGENAVVLLSEKPVMTATADEVTVKAGEVSYVFPLENYVDIVFVDAEENGIGINETDAKSVVFSVNSKMAIVENLNAGDIVSVFSIGGFPVTTESAKADGIARIDLSKLPTGAYVIAVNGVSFKILL